MRYHRPCETESALKVLVEAFVYVAYIIVDVEVIVK